MVVKSKQFYSDCTLVRRFIIAAFNNCPYGCNIGIEDKPFKPGQSRVFGRGSKDPVL